MSSPEPNAAPETAIRKTFPGEDLIGVGLADIAAGRRTVAALLLAAARPRLARVGVELPANDLDATGRELYAMLEQELGNRAHARYNALHRQVISYCAALAQDARRRR